MTIFTICGLLWQLKNDWHITAWDKETNKPQKVWIMRSQETNGWTIPIECWNGIEASTETITTWRLCIVNTLYSVLWKSNCRGHEETRRGRFDAVWGYPTIESPVDTCLDWMELNPPNSPHFPIWIKISLDNKRALIRLQTCTWRAAHTIHKTKHSMSICRKDVTLSM